MNHLEQEKYYPSLLYSGDAVRYLAEEIKLSCALCVNEALALHPHTMLQFTPGQIVDAMEHGCSVLAIGENGQLAGFAQLWQYGFNQNGQQILEFGSWLSFQKGLGEKILKEAVILGKKVDPQAQLIAIVEEENSRAQEILQKNGALEIGGKFSPYIRTVQGEAAFMKIFDITTL